MPLKTALATQRALLMEQAVINRIIPINLSMVFTDSGVLNSTSKTENAIRRSHVIVGLIVTKIKVKPVRQWGLRIRTAPHAFHRMRRREYT